MTTRLRSALAYSGCLLSFGVLLDLALGSSAAARDPSFRNAHHDYHHGDSMIEDLGAAWERTAAGLLAERGRARGVEVLNLVESAVLGPRTAAAP